MNTSQQLDIFGGPDAGAMLRDAGMAEAEFAEALTGSDFCEVAYAAICYVARRHAEVHIDDILRYLKVKASHPNANGSPWRRAIKEGVILHSGRVRACASDAVKRSHQYPIYTSGLFNGRRA